MKTLFVGDSHLHGYYESDGKINAWQNNNYAEIYSDINNKEVIVYSLPGGCNRKYPTWIAAMLELHNDIDEIFIQSTYWNRFLLAGSKRLDYGEDIKSDHFIDRDTPHHPTVTRYTDHRVTEEYIELSDKVRPENFQEFTGVQFDDMGITANWKPFNEKYVYTKLWHELQTPLQYKDYCLDLTCIDSMVGDIPTYLYTLNDRQFLPNNINFYKNLGIIKIDIDAETWIRQNIGMDPKQNTLDGEHYNRRIHKIIAEKYLDYVKNT